MLGIQILYWIPISIGIALGLLIIGAISKHCLCNYLPSTRNVTNTVPAPSQPVNISQTVTLPTASTIQVTTAAPPACANIAPAQDNTAPPEAPSSKRWSRKSNKKPAQVEENHPTYMDDTSPASGSAFSFHNQGHCPPLPLEVKLENPTAPQPEK